MAERYEKDSKRWYPCRACGGEHASVTTLLDVIASPALTGWKVKNATKKLNFFESILEPYMESDLFEKVKTEAETLWMKKEGTLFWKSGKELGKEAADYGTLAHAAIESHLHGKEVDLASLPEPARNSVMAFQGWAKQHTVKVIETEKTFYGCKFNVAGTADFVGEIDGELTILDHKTSSGIFLNQILQAWIYALIDESQHGDRLYKQVALGRWGKDGVAEYKAFKRNAFPGIDEARKVLVACGDIFSVLTKYDVLFPYKKKEK